LTSAKFGPAALVATLDRWAQRRNDSAILGAGTACFTHGADSSLNAAPTGLDRVFTESHIEELFAYRDMVRTANKS